MHFAYWMILAAASLPYLTIFLVKRAGGGHFDNHKPRPWLENLSGWRQRGDWAHRNHLEVFPIFAAAVFVAELTQGPQDWIDLLAGSFVILRILYTVLYIADLATLRSIVWTLGFAVTVSLFVLGA
jgi:uncharacterized MAPEG superfamily protein